VDSNLYIVNVLNFFTQSKLKKEQGKNSHHLSRLSTLYCYIAISHPVRTQSQLENISQKTQNRTSTNQRTCRLKKIKCFIPHRYIICTTYIDTNDINTLPNSKTPDMHYAFILFKSFLHPCTQKCSL
jgi:hypothetical protein